jgi:hypothetical protein
VEVELQPTAYVKCGACGGRVDVLTHPGSDVSFVHALRGALILPVGLPELLYLLALAAVAGELDALQTPARSAGLLAWSVVAWLWGVALVRATAEGAATLREVRMSFWPELLRPALVAASLTAPTLLVPRTGWPGALVVTAAAVVLLPTLLAVFALEPLGHALSPLRAVRTLLRLGGDGVLAMACLALLWLFARMLSGLAESPPTEVPALWSKTLDALAALALFLVPRVLGLLVEARGEDLGYPFKRRGEVPVLPGARPEVTVAYRPPEPPPRAPPAPIALDDASGEFALEPLAPTGDPEA